MKNIQALLAATLLAGAACAQAGTIIASDSFTITSVSKSSPNSVKNDAGGEGWAGGWQTKAKDVPQIVKASKMEGATALEFTKNADQAAFRLLEETQTGDVLVDFLLQISGAPVYNTFVGLWFGNSADSLNMQNGPNIGLKTDCGVKTGCADDLFARSAGVGGPFMPRSAVTAGVTYHLFGHLYKSKGSSAYDRFDAWFNPTAKEMRELTTPDVRATGRSNIKAFDTIGFRTSGLTSGVSVRVDALRLTTVPEPGTLALMGLAGAGFGFLRRRRKA